ncbi:MAG: right-handed parallel beta-helix repeat-containing protein [Thermoguttaceae bacterium]|nr:right-handed parallel beta-helix repeat-containing protein [Thermoguttaceae bacterium]
MTFAAGLTGLNPTKTYELTSAHDGLVIDGDDRIVFDNKTFIIFTQTGSADVTFKGLTFSNISPSGHGTAYSCTVGFSSAPLSKTVTFEECAFTGNTNSGSTSAIAAIGINAYVKNSTFTGNIGGYAAIWTGFGNLTVEGSTFTSNTGPNGGGGAIYAQTWGTNTYKVTVIDSTFENNSGLGSGAIYTTASETVISGSTFTGNVSSNDGGAISTNEHAANKITVTDSTFTNNRGGKGGAIFTQLTDVTITDSEFTGNTATSGFGGAVSAVRINDTTPTISIDGCEFTSNSAATSGGAVYSELQNTNISDSTFTGNHASEGGAVYASHWGYPFSTYLTPISVVTSGNTFTENWSTSNGGAISLSAGNLQDTDSVFTGNYAYDASFNRGGAVYINYGYGGSSFTGTRFIENRASGIDAGLGGAVFASAWTGNNDDNNKFDFTGAFFDGNEASAETNYYGEGGAVYVNARYNTFTSSTFTNNSAYILNDTLGTGDVRGGAVAVIACAETRFYNCTLTGNIAGGSAEGSTYRVTPVYGGAIDAQGTVHVIQSLIADNVAYGGKGGGFNAGNVGVTLWWSTVAGNDAASGADIYNGGAMSILYSIADQVANVNNLTVTASLYGAIANTGTSAADEASYQLRSGDILFRSGSYELAPGSVAINKTGQTAGWFETDLNGNNRVVGDYADYGAFEYQGSTLPLALSFSVADKEYDGTAAANVTGYTLEGVAQGDDVTVNVTGAAFDGVSVGTHSVTVTYTLGGSDAGRYLASVAPTIATITLKQLSISGTSVADKDYDGTTAADITVGTLSGVAVGESVGVTASGAFPASAVGTYDVTVSYTLTGADAANYIAPAAQTFSTSINALPTPEITFAGAEKVYTAAAQSITISGAIEGDTVLYSTDGIAYSADVPAYTNVGEYTVYAKVQRTGYTDWTGSAALTITPATITAVGTAEDKTYDGNTAASASATLSGVLGQDEVTVSVSGAFADKNAGTEKTVDLTYELGGAQGGNYVLDANATATANINKLRLSINGTAVADKEYDGTTAANITVGLLSGAVEGESVDVTASGAFPAAAVGTYDVTVSYTLTGDDAANYLAPAAQTFSASITVLPVPEITFASKSVVYNGEAQSITVSGTASGDVVLYSADGAAYSADVPAYTNVGEYTVYAKVQRTGHADWTGSAVLSITPAAFSVTFNDASTVFDGEAHSLTVSGQASGDVVEYSTDGGASYSQTAPTFTDAGTYTVGARVRRANYSDWTGSATLTIDQAEFNVTFDDASTVYDGTAHSITVSVGSPLVTPTVLYSYNGSAYSATAPVFTDAGTYTVYAKVQGANYNEWTGSATLTIGKKELTNIAAKVATKVYDGTTTATVAIDSVDGLVGSDTISSIGLGVSGAFDSAQRGLRDVAVSYTLDPAAGRNYTLASASDTIQGAIVETPSMVVTTADDGVADPYDNKITLREALGVYFKTNGTVSGYNGEVIYNTGSNTTVTFASGLTTMSVTQTRTSDGVTRAFTLTSNHDGLVIDGDNRIVFDGQTCTVFFQNAPADVTFKGITFQNINSSEVQGSAYSCTLGFATGSSCGKTVTIEDCTFDGNTNTGGGSAVVAVGINALVKNSTFSGNTGYHAPLRSGFCTLTVQGSTFTGNVTNSSGGAIGADFESVSAPCSSVTITDSTFTNNSTSYDGGAIFTTAKSTSISGTTFTTNTASRSGGALATANDTNKTETITIDGCGFTGNTAAGGNGGALRIENFGGNALTMTNTTLSNNTASSFGGAAHLNGCTFQIKDQSKFIGNTSGNSGGALYVGYGGSSSIANTEFKENKAVSDTDIAGGAIIFDANNGTLTISGSTFKDNYARTTNGNAFGGAISRSSGTEDSALIISSTDFSGNYLSATGGAYGGAINTTAPTTTITGGTFNGNKAPTGNGGAVCAASGTSVTVSGATFENNEAFNGGAVYSSIDSTSISGNFSGNKAAGGDGGALFVSSSASKTVTLSNSQFTGNSATGAGGAARLAGCTYTISGSTFTSNRSEGSFTNGGALQLDYSGVSTISGCTFTTNVATGAYAGKGGAIHFTHQDSKVTISDSTFSHNQTYAPDYYFAYGGAICRETGTGDLVIEKSDIEGNNSFFNNGGNGSSGVAKGGGIFMDGAGGTLTLSGTTVRDNSTTCVGGAENVGGGLYLGSSVTASITNYGDIAGSFSGNSAANGGAIYTDSPLTTISGCSFTSNTASENGGAIACTSNGCGISIDYSRFAGNKVSASSQAFGGAIYLTNQNAEMTINHSEFTDNIVKSTQGGAQGGAIARRAGDINGAIYVYNTTFLRNKAECSAGAQGGAISLGNGSDVCALTLVQCLVAENATSSSGGASFGGAMYSQAGTSVAYYYSTITNNSVTGASPIGGGFFNNGNVVLSGSILYGNTAGTGYDACSNGALYFMNSLFNAHEPFCIGAYDATTFGNNYDNTTNQPVFAGGSYQLASNSVAIDRSGLVDSTEAYSSVLAGKDLAGNTRTVGDYMDYGAFEYQGSAVDAAFADYDPGQVDVDGLDLF